MKQDIIQTSFASGEFGPSVLGRSDIAQWENACQTVQNFIPRPYGSAISMPGTVYVATVSDSTLSTRLIPFVFNQTDSYVIEMGDLYMRFYTNRGQVLTSSGTEDLSAYTANLKAHWKCNDNTNSTTVVDAVLAHDGTTGTLTSSLTTTAIVSTGLNLGGTYYISVADHADFTRTASTQPMTIVGWAYYDGSGVKQVLWSKPTEYELYIDSSGYMTYGATSSNASGAVLLLHCDGTDGSTSFTDSSASSHTVTANGNAQIDTAQYVFGTASALFDGAGDYLEVADSADWDFGTGAFTIDFRIRFASTGGTQVILDRYTDVSNNYKLEYDGTLRWTDTNTTQKSVAWTPLADTWYHVAVVQSGGGSGTLRFFINGTELGTATSTNNNLTGTAAIRVGANASGGSAVNGWIDEFRIVKGTAIWTADFTPPASAYAGSATNRWTATTNVASGWHLFGIVQSGDCTSSGDVALYVDGTVLATTFSEDASFIKMVDSSQPFLIGSGTAGGANKWQSSVDNIAFLHQSLTSGNMSGLYTSTTPYQISTVFTQNEIFDVQFTQLNDIIWLAHPNHPPQQLTRTSADSWAISNFANVGGPFRDENTNTAITLTASGTTGTVNITVTPTNSNLFTVSGSTLGHKNSYWMIGGLSQTSATTGLQEQGYVQLTYITNSYTATATVIKNLKSTSATSVWAEGAWSAVRGYPACVAFHERRLWWARTDSDPEHIWGSKVFSYYDYALDTQADDDGLNLPLAANESNEIQWLASGRSLIAGTYGGGFVLKSGNNSIITPDTVTATEDIGVGTAKIQPKVLSNFVYFVQRFKTKMRELFYNWDLDAFKAIDRTILAPHIIEAKAVQIDAQQNPDTILYVVLEDGTLATMTREVDQQVVAWAKHTTAGTYTSIAIIPSQVKDYDEAWVIVERWINGSKKKYVEYFEDVTVPDRQDQCVYLHSALTYDAYQSTTSSNASISLSGTAGSVTLTSSTAYFNSNHVNRTIRAINTLTGETLGQGTITATSSTTSITLSITTAFNALSYSAGGWGMSVRSVAGLGHLNAKTVGILADGQVDSLTRTIASNSVTLTSLAFVVTVGLSYDQVLYTLPKEAATARGTAQSKFQRYNEIALKVNRSTQRFQYGPDSSNLDTINLGFVPTVNTLYTGFLPSAEGGLAMRGGYVRGAQIYIKNSNPLPIEILQLIGTLDTKDK